MINVGYLLTRSELYKKGILPNEKDLCYVFPSEEAIDQRPLEVRAEYYITFKVLNEYPEDSLCHNYPTSGNLATYTKDDIHSGVVHTCVKCVFHTIKVINFKDKTAVEDVVVDSLIKSKEICVKKECSLDEIEKATISGIGYELVQYILETFKKGFRVGNIIFDATQEHPYVPISCLDNVKFLTDCKPLSKSDLQSIIRNQFGIDKISFLIYWGYSHQWIV